MRKLIRGDRQVTDDAWHYAELEGPLPEGDVIVPLARWQAEKDALRARPGRVGVQLAPADEVEALAGDLAHLDLVAVTFPAFRDGRGYSQARLLRERYGFSGEIRAVGDVLRDQLLYMRRVGIDAFELREDQDPDAALAAFADFSTPFQTAADGALPIWRRRRASA